MLDVSGAGRDGADEIECQRDVRGQVPNNMCVQGQRHVVAVGSQARGERVKASGGVGAGDKAGEQREKHHPTFVWQDNK